MFLFVLVVYGVIWQRQRSRTTFRDLIDNVPMALEDLIDDVSISTVQLFEEDSITNITNNSSEIVIFAATRFFGEKLERFNYLDKCSKKVQKYCVLTSDEKRFSIASAVVFHDKDYRHLSYYKKNKYFNHRNASIPYVFWILESPMHKQRTRFEKYPFNWTMSYDLSSDVVFPYGYIKKRNIPNNSTIEKIWNMKKTSKTGADIVWIVSNCETVNKRMEIVKKMQNLGLKIDIFGKCGEALKSCERDRGDMNCENEAISPYKFYIAIENSICKDYVTEKFWRNMKYRFTVPIVLGHKTYSDLKIPEPSFIALDNFASIAEFVKYMKTKIENRDEYLEFHRWRNDFEVRDESDVPNDDHGFCQLCRKLHSGEHLRNKTTINRRWHTVENCKNDIGYRFL